MASRFICDDPSRAPASRQCAACSSTITRAPGARGALPSHCGKPCKRPVKQAKPVKVERACVDCAAPIMVVKSALTSRCKPCGRIYGNANAHATRTANALAKHARICKRCGVSFQRMRNSTGRYCSKACSRVHATKEEARRIARAARRSLERGATVEHVDPFKVFDRDGWRCQLCGIATPRRLRGSKAPNAPQLDHIEPIAKGGEHSYRNTQCACRKCNAAKGMGKGGQLRLF